MGGGGEEEESGGGVGRKRKPICAPSINGPPTPSPPPPDPEERERGKFFHCVSTYSTRADLSVRRQPGALRGAE